MPDMQADTGKETQPQKQNPQKVGGVIHLPGVARRPAKEGCCELCGQPCVRTYAYTTWINGKLTAIRVCLKCLPPSFDGDQPKRAA